MSRKPKIIYFVVVPLLILAVICMFISLKLSTNTKMLITGANSKRGEYWEEKAYMISEEDFRTLAGFGCGTEDYTGYGYDWSLGINYAHTLCVGVYAYTYAQDSCSVFDRQNELCTGYRRHLKITWRLTSDGWVIEDIYTYVEPGILQRYLFFDDEDNYLNSIFKGR